MLIKHLGQCLVPSKLYLNVSILIIFMMKTYVSEIIWAPHWMFWSQVKGKSQSSEMVRMTGRFYFHHHSAWSKLAGMEPHSQRSAQRSLHRCRITADPTTQSGESK